MSVVLVVLPVLSTANRRNTHSTGKFITKRPGDINPTSTVCSLVSSLCKAVSYSLKFSVFDFRTRLPRNKSTSSSRSIPSPVSNKGYASLSRVGVSIYVHSIYVHGIYLHSIYVHSV